MEIKYSDLKEEFTFEATFSGLKIDPCKIWMVRPRPCQDEKSGWCPIHTAFHYKGEEEWEPHIKQLLAVIAHVYDLTGQACKEEAAHKMTGEIRLTAANEFAWIFKQAWPHHVDFGELIYTSDPSFDINVTWKFKECEWWH